MSRHSKNCTAHSIFTYNEKLKLMRDSGTTGFGTNKARIGKDSQKRFDQCELCLNRVPDGSGPMWSKSSAPVVCKEGHIFCRECIIENMMKQKKDNDRAQKLYQIELQQVEQKKQNEKQDEVIKQTTKFQENQMKLPEANQKETTEKQQIIQELTNKDTVVRNEAKKEWIKTSFWMPENTPQVKDEGPKAPSKSLFCPIFDSNKTSSKHQIKLKELIPLHFNCDSDLLTCWVCSKQLQHQKISVLKSCGHVFCRTCLKDYCRQKCSQCDTKNEGVIDLHESGSSYSGHSKVESKVYQPVFQ